MIFFFTGGPKHGSHFQLYIITEGLNQKGITYGQAGINIVDRNDSPGTKRLLDEINQKREEIFICKGHFLDKELLLSYADIRIFLIWREIGDVLVSRYHYLIHRYGQTFDDFADFYRKDGRNHTFYQTAYHHLWQPVTDQRVFHVNYSDLRKDFQNAVRPMLDFAGLSDVDVEALEEKVSIERSRKKHNDPKGVLIRKGAVGEYESVIPPEILEDIEHIRQMSTLQLKIQAFLNNPKVVISQYYNYPGKSMVTWMLKQRRRFLDKKEHNASDEREIVWWD